MNSHTFPTLLFCVCTILSIVVSNDQYAFYFAEIIFNPNNTRPLSILSFFPVRYSRRVYVGDNESGEEMNRIVIILYCITEKKVKFWKL